MVGCYENWCYKIAMAKGRFLQRWCKQARGSSQIHFKQVSKCNVPQGSILEFNFDRYGNLETVRCQNGSRGP